MLVATTMALDHHGHWKFWPIAKLSSYIQVKTVLRRRRSQLYITDKDMEVVVVEKTGTMTSWMMKILLFSTCAHIRAVVLCLLASTAVVLTSMESSVCFYNVFEVFPRSTCVVETPTRFFWSYYCAHIHAQLRRNVRGRKCSFSSRYILACFSFTRCCLK